MLLTRAKYISTASLKIVSLVPSQTELLYDLGLEAAVTGITKFCVHPPKWFRTKKRIGGTKTLNIDIIRQLKPTLIIANKEENVKEQVQLLANEFNVWLTDVNNLKDALSMIADIGILTGTSHKATQLIGQIGKEFLKLNDATGKKIPAAYLIWKEPYMTIGGDTFINSIMQLCGLQNIFEDRLRYPVISIEEIKDKNCETLLLSSEPYPFKQKHIDELQLRLPQTKIIMVDGEMFSWYGSRLLKAPAYLKTLVSNI